LKCFEILGFEILGRCPWLPRPWLPVPGFLPLASCPWLPAPRLIPNIAFIEFYLIFFST